MALDKRFPRFYLQSGNLLLYTIAIKSMTTIFCKYHFRSNRSQKRWRPIQCSSGLFFFFPKITSSWASEGQIIVYLSLCVILMYEYLRDRHPDINLKMALKFVAVGGKLPGNLHSRQQTPKGWVPALLLRLLALATCPARTCPDKRLARRSHSVHLEQGDKSLRPNTLWVRVTSPW